MRPDKELIEPRFKDSIDNYVSQGWRPGGFITACLMNDLTEAFARADDMALENIPHIVAYMYEEVPAACHGSMISVKNWLERGWKSK